LRSYYCKGYANAQVMRDACSSKARAWRGVGNVRAMAF
jgi:hypothetical protein